MLSLQGETIYLRALEPEDLEYIYTIENDASIWELSNTMTPYSRYLIKEYLDNAHKDIYEVKQLRLLISDYKHNTLGLIDVFDFDPKNHRAGVGILISSETNRHKGIATEALSLLINYCFKHLQVHQLYCNITEDNIASIKLFTNAGFVKVGVKRDWTFVDGIYKDEGLYQLVR